MTVGSVFSGIGGFDLAATRVFGPDSVRWQIEVDPWAQRVLAKHWPEVPRFGDIREVSGDELEPVDIVALGFPCNDTSQIGKGAGITGERSGLWSEGVRLLRHLRPRYVLVENVPGLLNGGGIGRVLGDLAALGFDAEWESLPAAAVGAPQLRERVWLVAYSVRLGLEGVIPTGAEARATLRSSRLRWTAEPGVGRMAPRLPDFVDRIRGLGNSVVPQVAEVFFCWIAATDTPLT